MEDAKRARVGKPVRQWDARAVRNWKRCAFLGARQVRSRQIRIFRV